LGGGFDVSDEARRLAHEATPRAVAGRAAMRTAMQVAGERRVIVDVAGIRATAPGQAAYRCLLVQAKDEMDRLRSRSGFDPLAQVDEMAVIDGLPFARGRYEGVDWEKMRPGDGATAEPHGEKGMLYLDGDRGVAVWDGQILIGDGNRDQLEAALDRIEGRIPADPDIEPLAGTSGQLKADDLFEVLPIAYDVAEPVRTYLEEHGGPLTFAVAVAADGVRVSVHFQGDEELQSTLGAALEAARGGGVVEELRERFGDLLKNMEIKKENDGLLVQVFAPMAALQQLMGPCALEGEEP
ncbi:MAG: hypothetical protein KC549_17025, partial [Myxococcales bacterium]|nr:hypothetical protein [Myxococcales bacterium]